MLAVPIKDLNKTHKGAVAFEMKHALTSIGFTAAGALDTITSIAVTNISSSGKLIYDETANILNWTVGPVSDNTYNALPNDSAINIGGTIV